MKSFIICVLASFITVALFAQKAKQHSVPYDSSRQVIYSCSMHPEYVSFIAAKCPVCGENLSKKEIMKMEIAKLYTCPMDDVTSTKAGKCPKCGMDMVKYKPKSKSGNH